MPDTSTSNRMLFNERGVTVTREIANIRGTSYPINGIGSVRVMAPNRLGPYLFGAGLIFVGLYSIKTTPDYFWIWILAGLSLFLIAYMKPCTLIIHTASSDRPALTGRKELLVSIKRAIESAVTLRG